MAKELPYFKFEPNQWENGNIQMCSREDKGLFIDLCSMYWSRLGDLPLKLAVQKLCGGNATAFDSLCDEKIIEVIDGNIFIKFLSEQLAEFGDLSKKNSENARSGWEKRRKQKELSDSNATAYDSQWDRNAIREEKKRKDNIKEDNNIILSEIKISDHTPRKRFVPPNLVEVKDYCFERNNQVDAQRFIDYYTSNGWMVGKNKMKDWKSAVRTWEKNNYSINNSNDGNKQQSTVRTGDDQLADFIRRGLEAERNMQIIRED